MTAATTARAKVAEPPADEEAGSKPEPESETDAEAVARLAKLNPLEYDRTRDAEAKRLKVHVGALDQMVAQERGDKANAENGKAAPFPELKSWPVPVDGVELLDKLAEIFIRHLILPISAADALALWVMHAHAHETSSISPLLAITSPTPECGKTTLLILLCALVPRALPASNITAAALFRAIEKWTPTLIVDEADTFLRDSDELRGVINSGHNRGAAYVIRTVGDDHDPKHFKTWSPKAIALIGKLSPTLASRSIHIEMRRMAPGERVEPIQADRLDHLQPLARQAARWVVDHHRALRDAEPIMPATIAGRRADNWRHLFIVADVVGGDWPERVRRAAENLSAGDAELTAAITLLGDLRAIFSESGSDKITSAELAVTLTNMETRPWPEWLRGKPITPRQIAKLLEPFGIRPKDLRLADGRTGIKGYRVEEFTDAFFRYLPDLSATTLHSKESASVGDRANATRDAGVADGNSRESADSQGCSDVADADPGTWDVEL